MKKRIIGATLLTVVCALLISNLVGVLMFRSREVEAARENLRVKFRSLPTFWQRLSAMKKKLSNI